MRLEELNRLDAAALSGALRHCCGSSVWVAKMGGMFPMGSVMELYAAASAVWRGCGEGDWLEAFGAHPKIGERVTGVAAAEQAGTSVAAAEVLDALAEGNKRYFEKFGYIFIVCATGKSAVEMLELLRGRLGNEPEKEILVAMGEQEKITRIRLEKLLS